MSRKDTIAFYNSITITGTFAGWAAEGDWAHAAFNAVIETPKGTYRFPFKKGLACVRWRLPGFSPKWGSLADLRSAVGNGNGTRFFSALEHSLKQICLTGKNPNKGNGPIDNALSDCKAEPLTKDEVMYCLAADFGIAQSMRSFSDYCSELGYDSDSIKARNQYEALRIEADELAKIGFTHELDDFVRFMDNNSGKTQEEFEALWLAEEEKEEEEEDLLAAKARLEAKALAKLKADIRKFLVAHPGYSECVYGMGTFFLKDVAGEIVHDGNGADDLFNAYQKNWGYPTPFRFTATGPEVTDW